MLINLPNSASNAAVDICASGAIAYQIVLGNYALRATHGILMIIAFVLMSPVATVIARYLKKQLDGGKWFRYHRLLQVRHHSELAISQFGALSPCRQSPMPTDPYLVLDGGADDCIGHSAICVR